MLCLRDTVKQICFLKKNLFQNPSLFFFFQHFTHITLMVYDCYHQLTSYQISKHTKQPACGSQ